MKYLFSDKYWIPRLAVILSAMAACLCASSLAFSSPLCPAFLDLGSLVPEDVGMHWAAGVSDDGSVVVGQSSTSPSSIEAFRWAADTDMLGLGFLPGGGSNSIAWAISGDGSTITGGSDTASGFEAFRWAASEEMVPLGHLPGGGTFSEGNAISTDGSVIVGQSDSAEGLQACIWTPSGFQGLGFLPGGSYSVAYAVSGNGSVVFGQSESALGFEAFRWTPEDGMMSLGDLPGGDLYSYAEACSADGQFVVGGSASAASGSNSEAFIWTEESGMVGLGDLPGGLFKSSANAVSDGGSIVVGNSHVGLPPSPGEPLFAHAAFIWDETNGMRSLQDVLETGLDLDLMGFNLHSATGLSADGMTTVGWMTKDTMAGTLKKPYLACVPEPGTGVLCGLALPGIVMYRRWRRTK